MPSGEYKAEGEISIFNEDITSDEEEVGTFDEDIYD